MPSELVNALTKRRTNVDQGSQVWESEPSKSMADASHLASLTFNTLSAQEWLRTLEKTPEEDLLSEALAEGLAERGLHGPQHAPLEAKEEDNRRLQQLSDAYAHMKADLANQEQGIGKAKEDLARREEELRRREEELEAEKQRQRRNEEARRNYPQPRWLENVQGTMNIGVVGNSGVGKSLLINKLRRIRPHADGWAPVGVNETTTAARLYPFPGSLSIRLWDLPGAGTEAIPADTYIQQMGLRYFDKVLVVTAGRFTSLEATLTEELERHGVPHCMVRTKIDIDVWNNMEDNGMDEAATVQAIRDDLRGIRGLKGSLYLVSSRDPDLHDMPRLMEDLFPHLKPRLDPTASTFCPGVTVWNEPWALPVAHSAALSGLQGRWRDNHGAYYLVQGDHVHVSMGGEGAVVALTQEAAAVWWLARWFVNAAGALKARNARELRWTPVNIHADRPLVWWWCD